MVGEAGMPDRWVSHGGPPGRARHLVVVENVESVGLALALSLLRAGYGVLGSNVSDTCLAEFQAAGGAPVTTAPDEREIAWSIECHEKPGVRPEILSRLSSARPEHGRARLELSGSNRSLEGYSRDAVATLAIVPGQNMETALHVALDVNPKGLQLIVRGERSLFEAALPVLTVLADRVLYAGPGQDNDDRFSRESSCPNHSA